MTNLPGIGFYGGKTNPGFLASDAGNHNGGASSLTWSHTVTADTSMLVVNVGCSSSSNNNARCSGITFNGTPLVLADEVIGYYFFQRTEYTGLWYLVNPTGSGNIVASFSNSPNVMCGGVGMDLTGVDTLDVHGHDVSSSGSGAHTIIALTPTKPSLIVSGIHLESGGGTNLTGTWTGVTDAGLVVDTASSWGGVGHGYTQLLTPALTSLEYLSGSIGSTFHMDQCSAAFVAT